MEYPVIECKEANVGFWNVLFPMFFSIINAFCCFIFGSVSSLAFTIGGNENLRVLYFILIPSAISAIVAFVIALKPIMRYFLVKINGQEIYATVYGYMNDNILLNGTPAQIVKLLVNTHDGKKFILYQLSDIKQPFKVNSQIKLKVYKDIFLIENKKQYYF